MLVVSVDVEGDEPKRGTETRNLTATLTNLVDLLAEHALPATWALDDPAAWCAQWRDLGDLPPGHDLALRCLTAVEQRPATLRNRLAHSRAEGWNVETVVTSPQWVRAHGTLLRGESIHASYLHEVTSRRSSLTWHHETRQRPRAIRHGLWMVPVTHRVGRGRSTASRLMEEISIRRALVQAADRAEVVHLDIDAQKLAAAGRGGIKAIVRIARDAKAANRESQLMAHSVASAARHLAMPHATTPSRSILIAKAA
jgi:hypothetical protein